MTLHSYLPKNFICASWFLFTSLYSAFPDQKPQLFFGCDRFDLIAQLINGVWLGPNPEVTLAKQGVTLEDFMSHAEHEDAEFEDLIKEPPSTSERGLHHRGRMASNKLEKELEKHIRGVGAALDNEIEEEGRLNSIPRRTKSQKKAERAKLIKSIRDEEGSSDDNDDSSKTK